MSQEETSRTVVAALAALAVGSASAIDVSWQIIKPSNTGIPGEEVRVVRFAPDGKLWVGARWPFWREGGVGIYDFTTEAWTTFANWETPIPSEFINDIEFEPGGVAWIATDRGLVRFDGVHWKVYDPGNSPMQLYKVLNVALAPDGHIWINNSDSNYAGDALFDFDGVDTWRRFSATEMGWSHPWTDLSEVFVDRHGHVWVANDTLPGVAEYDSLRWTLRGQQLTPFGTIVQDTRGYLWLMAHRITGEDAFYRWDGSRFQRYAFYEVNTISTDPEDGSVYAGNWLGTILRSINGETFTTYLSGLNPVYNIAPAPGSSDVWVGTLGAVGHFRADGSLIRDYNSYNTVFPWYWVSNIYTDRRGHLWFATDEAGASRWDGRRWRNWGAHNAGSEPWPFLAESAFGLYQDTSGYHWIGSNGVGRLDPNTWNQETWDWRNDPDFGVGLYCYFAQDMNGTLFTIEQYGRTLRFHPGTGDWTIEPVQPYAPLGVPGAGADSRGNIWIAAWFDIHKWDGVAWTKVTLPYRDYFFDLGGINCMAIDARDVLWLGTRRGLVRWDGQTFQLYNSNNSGLPLNPVTGVAVRSDGLLGLSMADGDQWPYKGAVSLVRGDPGNRDNWTSFRYGESPLPHWPISAPERRSPAKPIST